MSGQLRPTSVTVMNLVANVLNKLLVAGVTDEGKFFTTLATFGVTSSNCQIYLTFSFFCTNLVSCLFSLHGQDVSEVDLNPVHWDIFVRNKIYVVS